MTLTGPDHPADGALIRMISDTTAPVSVRQHVDVCARCRTRVDRMRYADGRLAALFAPAADSPVPRLRQPGHGAASPPARAVGAGRLRGLHTRSYLPWAAAAAAGLLLIAGVPQLRALLLRPVIDRLAARGAVEAPAQSAPPGAFRVSFPVRDSVLIVDIVAAQRAGEIVMTVHAGDLALVRSTATTGRHEVDVEIGRVSIRNEASSAASYTLLIPPDVRMRLVVAGVEIPVTRDTSGSFRWRFGDPPRDTPGVTREPGS